MKRNYVMMLMGIALAAASISVSAQETDAAQRMIVGEVTVVGSNFIEVREADAGDPQENGTETADETENVEKITVISLMDDTQFYRGSSMQPPEKPDGEQSGDEAASEKPDGEQPEDEAVPEKPDSEQMGNESVPEMTDGGNPGQAEEISLEELETGDMVMITLDEDGNAQTVRVQPESMTGGQPGAGMNPGGVSGDSGQPGENAVPGGMESGEAAPGDMGPGGAAPDGMGPGGAAPDGMGPGGAAPDGMGPNGAAPGGMAPGQSQGPESYDAVTEITEDTALDGEQIESTGSDENAVLISGSAQADLNNLTVTRSSEESTGGDNASFYGVGAAVLATGGTTYLSDSIITTDASGGAGVFAYGDGVVYADGCTIDTQQDTSGGIHVAGGGTLYAQNTTSETDGRSAAAVRSDRGGGTMVIDGGSYTSNGSDSPAVYCTADISIHDADLTANGSEAVCIEGLNTLRLYDCALTGNMSDDERNDNTWTVIVYQSMSGDSQEGNGTFQMEGGTLSSGNGGIFYTTNTESTILLKNVTIQGAEDSEFFLQCTGNTNSRGWGSAGSNGADCLFTGVGQQMTGDVIWDSVSTLDFYMTEGSLLTGAVCRDDTYASGGSGGSCNVVIDADSEWIVTGDSEVTNLAVSGRISDAAGRTVTVKGTDGTVYAEGDSDYTITTETYNTDADLSGAASGDSWEEHAADLPI